MQWNLIRLRKGRNLNQKDMAELLNISENAYGMKERGKLQFTADEMFELSDFFKMPLDQIFLPRNFGDTEICGVEEKCTTHYMSLVKNES